MKYRPLLVSLSLIIAILGCNLPSFAPATAAPDSFPTDTPALPVDTPLPSDTALPGVTPLETNPPPPADPPLPAAPSKPKNFNTDGSATAIAFTWNDDSTNENGFRIYQEGVTAPVISVDAHAATGGMSYNWTGLACGFKSTFTIRAYNDAGESAASNSEKGVTIPCQPGNLIAYASGNTISFNWSVATIHNEDGFRIYQQGVTAAVGTRGPNLGSGGTNFDLSGLPCNLVATYSVRAFNDAGESPASNLVQSESVPCGPTNLQLTSATDIVVEYSWSDNATSETGFHIYQDDVLYATLPAHPGTGTMSSASVDICGRNHVYSVRAFNYAGESVTSEHVGMSTLPC